MLQNTSNSEVVRTDASEDEKQARADELEASSMILAARADGAEAARVAEKMRADELEARLRALLKGGSPTAISHRSRIHHLPDLQALQALDKKKQLAMSLMQFATLGRRMGIQAPRMQLITLGRRMGIQAQVLDDALFFRPRESLVELTLNARNKAIFYHQFKVTVTKGPGDSIGLDVDSADQTTLGILRVNDGLISKWNQSNPSRQVLKGDRIVDINGCQDDSNAMLDVAKVGTTIEMTLIREMEAQLEPGATLQFKDLRASFHQHNARTRMIAGSLPEDHIDLAATHHHLFLEAAERAATIEAKWTTKAPKGKGEGTPSKASEAPREAKEAAERAADSTEPRAAPIEAKWTAKGKGEGTPSKASEAPPEATKAKRPSAFSRWTQSRMQPASDPFLCDPEIINIAGILTAQELIYPVPHRRFWSAAGSAAHRRPLATAYSNIDVSMLMLPGVGRHPGVQVTKSSAFTHRTQATTTFGSDRGSDGLRIYAFMGGVEAAETDTINNFPMYRELPCQFYGMTMCSVQARLSLPSAQQLLSSAVLPRLLVKGPVANAVIGGHSLGCLFTYLLALHLEQCGRAPRSLFRIDGRNVAPWGMSFHISTRREEIMSPWIREGGAVFCGRFPLVMQVEVVPKMRAVTHSVHYACRLTKAERLRFDKRMPAGDKAQPRAELHNPTAGLFLFDDTTHALLPSDLHWDLALQLRKSLQKEDTPAALPPERTNDDAPLPMQFDSLPSLPADEPARAPPAQNDGKMNTTVEI